MTRVVQVANFVTPTSGGLRTALQQLSSGYQAAGQLDLVEPGRTGSLFRSGSALDLRLQVERLVADESARLRMGRVARSTVQHRTWDAIGEQLLGHYAHAVQTRDELEVAA